MSSVQISKVGILNPGEMGSYIAHCAANTVKQVYWCSEGRSPATRARAQQQGLIEISNLKEFCASCELIISVCPPHAAQEQATAIINQAYKGIYVDANALAPATVINIGKQMQSVGITFVDAGIVGLASYKPDSTWLYLSGREAAAVANCFSKGPVVTKVLGPDIGQASALKMCYAAWNKGKNAMLTAVLAAAEQMGVREALEQQWDIYEPGFTQDSSTRLRNMARKAWRFGPEMEEIAQTLENCGVPPEFFIGAAELYRRESEFKDKPKPPELTEILAAVLQQPQATK